MSFIKKKLYEFLILLSSLIFVYLQYKTEETLINSDSKTYDFYASCLTYITIFFPNSTFYLMPDRINIYIRFILLIIISIMFTITYSFIRDKYKINRLFMFVCYVVFGFIVLQIILYIAFRF